MFLCGDVMLGRGVDQLMPEPGDPELREEYVRDARGYLELAEAVNGPIRRPVDPAWPWGDALQLLDERAPEVRVINLETSVTRSDDFEPYKAVHYRMNPANVGCLTVARPDVCVLANNHVLDFGRRGLVETLDVLAAARLATAGAGESAVEAWRPAVVQLKHDGRVLVSSAGASSSGIPPTWAARPDRPGVAFLPRLSVRAAAEVAARMRLLRRPGDITVASVHWGSNWGYAVDSDQRAFAHALIDGGVDIVHGHSSHHPRPMEVYRDRLILYGCGDFIDDYEGIRGHEAYRDDLRLLYLASVDAATGALVELQMVPFQARQMRLCRASEEDAGWLGDRLTRVSRDLGSQIEVLADGSLTLHWHRHGTEEEPGA
nr:CapA family protein [Microlunatus panaciterrae]